eukprot:5959751-Pyramimonas_sp.AAC.1
MHAQADRGELRRSLREEIPPHSSERKTILKDASSPVWLAHQMLQPATRVPPMTKNYIVPN